MSAYYMHHQHTHPSHIITMFLLGSFSAYLISKILEPAKLTEEEKQEAKKVAEQGEKAVKQAGEMAAALQDPEAMLMAHMGNARNGARRDGWNAGNV